MLLVYLYESNYYVRFYSYLTSINSFHIDLRHRPNKSINVVRQQM